MDHSVFNETVDKIMKHCTAGEAQYCLRHGTKKRVRFVLGILKLAAVAALRERRIKNAKQD
jgi:hypothetical protein